jgi:hypothetical protein
MILRWIIKKHGIRVVIFWGAQVRVQWGIRVTEAFQRVSCYMGTCGKEPSRLRTMAEDSSLFVKKTELFLSTTISVHAQQNYKFWAQMTLIF